MSRALWIADTLRFWGLKVIEVDGWKTRGLDTLAPQGVVCHHTAGPSNHGNMPSLAVVTNGRSDLPGPLCNIALGRDGTCYIVASGKANHAGLGGYNGMSGNSSVLGIEAENTGYEPWPAEQFNAYVILCAALMDQIRKLVANVCAHFEWAPKRKFDPHDFNMPDFRNKVQKAINDGHGGAPVPPEPPKKRGVNMKAAARNKDGRLEEFKINADGSVSHRWQTEPSGGWSGLVPLEPDAGYIMDKEQGIAAGENSDGRIELFATSGFGVDVHKWQDAAGNWNNWTAF